MKDVTRFMSSDSPLEVASERNLRLQERNMQLAKLVDQVKKQNAELKRENEVLILLNVGLHRRVKELEAQIVGTLKS